MPRGKQRKSLEDLELEINQLQLELRNRGTLLKAQEVMAEIEGKIAAIKANIKEKETKILTDQAERRLLIAELHKTQGLKRKQSRQVSLLETDYVTLETKLKRKMKELETRFNPSSREMG